jgi:hypothetical protein
METNRQENYWKTKEKMDGNTEEDIESMGIRRWRKLSKERKEWRRITEKTKTHSGL